MAIRKTGKRVLIAYLIMQFLSAGAHAKSYLFVDLQCKVMQVYGDSEEVTTKPGTLTALTCIGDGKPWKCTFSDKATKKELSKTNFNVEAEESGLISLRSEMGDIRVVFVRPLNRYILTQTSISSVGGLGFVTKSCAGMGTEVEPFK